jgi:hypothetical protein
MKRIIAIATEIVILLTSLLSAAPPAEAARRLQIVEAAPRFKNIYFGDGATIAGRYYCQIPRNGASFGLVSAYGGYYISLRNRPTLQLRQVRAGIALASPRPPYAPQKSGHQLQSTPPNHQGAPYLPRFFD